MDGGPLDVEAIGILEIFIDETVGQLADGDAFFVGTFDHLVVDISEILDIIDRIATVEQETAKGVIRNKGPGIAQVEKIVDSRTADVHLDLAGLDGLEFFFAAGFGVEDADHSVWPPIISLRLWNGIWQVAVWDRTNWSAGP